jgi:hypothetical protein
MFLIAQHVSSNRPLIIGSSITVIAASGFTYVYGCRQLSWLSHDSCRQIAPCIDMNIGYDNKIIADMSNINFFGITIENMSSKSHMDKLLPQLCAACYAIRVIKLLVSQDILKIVCCSYFHSIMNYSIIFWKNLSCSLNTFR